MSGVLYLIPCPISEDTLPYDVTPEGNREVITSLDYFIVENLRSARRFLSKAGLSGHIDELEFDELSEHTTSPRDVERMVAKIKAGRSAGVISEAGVPAVADPGQLVVEACHRAGIRIIPLVGPSSIIMAVMASGLSGQSFAFNGYLPNAHVQSNAWRAVLHRNISRNSLSRHPTATQSWQSRLSPRAERRPNSRSPAT